MLAVAFLCLPGLIRCLKLDEISMLKLKVSMSSTILSWNTGIMDDILVALLVNVTGTNREEKSLYPTKLMANE